MTPAPTAYAVCGVVLAACVGALTRNRIRNTIKVYRFRRDMNRNPYLGEVARLEHKIAETLQHIRDCIEGGDT